MKAHIVAGKPGEQVKAEVTWSTPPPPKSYGSHDTQLCMAVAWQRNMPRIIPVVCVYLLLVTRISLTSPLCPHPFSSPFLPLSLKAKFVAALLEAAKANGATLITDEVTGVVRKGEDREEVVGVRLREGGELRAAKVVLAMGPWTGRAKEWMEGIPDVQGDKAHSVVLQPPRGDVIDATAVFIGYSDKGKMEHPEIYPRPGQAADGGKEGESERVSEWE